MLSENVENTQNSTSCPQESPSLINPGKNYTDSRRDPIGKSEILTIFVDNTGIVRLDIDSETEQLAPPSPQDSSIINKF